MKVTTLCIAATFCSFAVSTSYGTGLLNGDFESPVLSGLGATYTSAPTDFAWQVGEGGQIDHLRDYFQPSSGYQCVDLNGWAKGSIYQDFQLSNTGFWQLSFDMAGNPDLPGIKTLRVEFGPAEGPWVNMGTFSFDSTGTSPYDLQWTTVDIPAFSALEGVNYRLQFISLNEGPCGPLLDNVRLALIPEPSVLALAIGAMASRLVLMRRKS